MKRFAGKIGKYRQLNQRQRSVTYLKRSREEKKMNRYYIDYYIREFGTTCERDLVAKLKVKRGGKMKAKQLAFEAWCDEMSSIGPNEGCSEWM
jgi:hypothetical protein